MELQKTKRQVSLERRRGVVQACRSSGLTVKAWCQQNDINETTYYRWQKQVWESEVQSVAVTPYLANEISFIEYQDQGKELERNQSRETSKQADAPALTLYIGEIRVEIQNGADEVTIEKVIRALRKLC